ncbi:MAG: bifunctional UDP-4-keto-pentose/UDP-xylose synthase [Candidatus Tectomicrobia bacterium]|nr:bifunctional UDP-4-keto-pentose/UDP-xylose synthase [Candidatus Tectomicrobia bacterium]
MQVLLLGGGGFIGSHMVSRLLQDTHHDILAYDLCADKLDDVMGQARLTYIHGDIRSDQERLEALVKDADLVVDLIAYANPSVYVSMPLEVYRLNFTENLRIVEYCVKHQKRLVQFSTCEVYGKTVVPLVGDKLPDPEAPEYAVFQEDTTAMILGPVSKHRWIYSCAKQLLERILHAYGLEDRLNYTIIRPFNFIGPRIDYLPSEQDGNPRVFSHFVQALKDGSSMPLVNGGHQKRTYTHIDDATECITRIVENRDEVCNQQIFNIGSPHNEVSIRELALKMRALYQEKWWDGVSPLPELVNISGDEFYGEGYDDSDRRIPDIGKAMLLLGWKPQYTLEETIERSMAYWFDHDDNHPTNRRSACNAPEPNLDCPAIDAPEVDNRHASL